MSNDTESSFLPFARLFVCDQLNENCKLARIVISALTAIPNLTLTMALWKTSKNVPHGVSQTGTQPHSLYAFKKLDLLRAISFETLFSNTAATTNSDGTSLLIPLSESLLFLPIVACICCSKQDKR